MYVENAFQLVTVNANENVCFYARDEIDPSIPMWDRSKNT